MLSAQEYQDIKWKLDHIPAQITGKPRQNLRTVFKKKLHEHDLASQYPPFQPSPYEQFFINHRTTESTLIHLIEAINSSTTFILDTESINIHKQPNKPALIQLQIILPTSFSYVVFIEVYHLPPTRQSTFDLTKRFFNTLFHPDKTIYIWGEIDELINFVQFNLFARDQIYLSNNINLQNYFKNYWNEHHPHQLSSSINDTPCICETCLGIQANNPWSLQNSMAYELQTWLDKRQSRSSFHIGLDTTLYHYNSNEIEHRQLMVQYAADDCLSIYQILVKLNLINEQQLPIDSTDFTVILPTSPLQPATSPTEYLEIKDTSNIIQENSLSIHLPEQLIPSYTNTQSETHDWELISSDDEELQAQPLSIESDTTVKHTTRQELSEQERKKIHNRSCTVKQRKRQYKYEIICRNIDRRFTFTDIKTILRNNSIPFCAVNTAKSSSNRKSLYIGIKNPKQLSKYETRTKHLFSTQNYYRLYPHRHQSNLNDRRYHYHNHY